MRYLLFLPFLLLAAFQAEARRAGCAEAPAPAPPEAGFNGMPRGERALALDGDTLRIEPDGYCVRLWALDAPEFKAPGGPAARAALDDLIAGQAITCTDTGQRSHGRMVARCMAGGKDLAEAMLRQGQAYTYRSFLDDSAEAKAYLAAETEARQAKRGLWAETVYTPSAWEMVPYAWQSLIGGLLAAFAAAAAVGATLISARQQIRAMQGQIDVSREALRSEKQATGKSEHRILHTRRQQLRWLKMVVQSFTVDLAEHADNKDKPSGIPDKLIPAIFLASSGNAMWVVELLDGPGLEALVATEDAIRIANTEAGKLRQKYNPAFRTLGSPRYPGSKDQKMMASYIEKVIVAANKLDAAIDHQIEQIECEMTPTKFTHDNEPGENNPA